MSTSSNKVPPSQEVPPLPQGSWDTPQGFVASLVFRALCAISVGNTTLDHSWAVIHEGGEAWKTEKDALLARINNLNVVAGLLLTTMSVILSTPPPAKQFIDWTQPVPYLCVLSAFSPALGALVVGGLMGLGVTAAQPDHFKRLRSRPQIVGLLIILSYPFVVMGIATIIFAIGLVAAAWATGYKLIRAGSLFALLLPAFVAPVFFWINVNVTRGGL